MMFNNTPNRAHGYTIFFVQNNKYNNANTNFYKLFPTNCNKSEINLIISIF